MSTSGPSGSLLLEDLSNKGKVKNAEIQYVYELWWKGCSSANLDDGLDPPEVKSPPYLCKRRVACHASTCPAVYIRLTHTPNKIPELTPSEKKTAQSSFESHMLVLSH